jgi:hypothetical protein
MNKAVIIINGAGGVGKDTLCSIAEKHFKVRNISSVDPIKEIAAYCGWRGEKTDKARKFLSDLKMLTVNYNDFPTNWAKAQYEDFLTTDEEILFVHIREPEEIRKYVAATNGKAKALLVRGGERTRHTAYGNASDDGVENYDYDYYFVNDKPLEETDSAFSALMQEILDKEQ